MRNKIYLNCSIYYDWDVILANILKELNYINSKLGTDIILPIEIKLEEYDRQIEKVKTLFGRTYNKEIIKYRPNIIFDKELTDEQYSKWMIFLHGMKIGNRLRIF